MNKSNFMHALFAVLMQAPFAAFGLPWVGAAFAIGFFISREHAHRQVDIRTVTGEPVPQQNPLKGFLGWSLDAKLDALFPTVAVLLVGYAYAMLVR